MTGHKMTEGDEDQAKKAETFAKTLDALRELRAEILDLQNVLTRVKDGKTNVKENAAYIKKTCEDVEKLVAELATLNKERRSDTIRHIFNVWEQMRSNPLLSSPEKERPTQEQLHELTILQEQCSEIVLSVGKRTIPARVNTWLSKARPGYYLPFYLLFEDELPSLEGRTRVLNTIAWAPDAIEGGIVSAESGLIYKYEMDTKAQYKSIGQVVLAFLGAVASIIVLCGFAEWIGVTDWPLKARDASMLIMAWGAILIGSLVHIAVAGVKRSKVSGLPPVIAVNDWRLYVSARKGNIMLKFLIALIGLFGLAFTLGPKVSPVNAFLVGYSLDSVVELFGTSIEQKAAAQIGALKEQLGISAEKKQA